MTNYNSDFDKVAFRLGLEENPDSSSSIVEQSTKDLLNPVNPTTTKEVALLPGKKKITASDSMFADVKSLHIYMKENEIQQPINWLHMGVAGLLGATVGFLAKTVIN